MADDRDITERLEDTRYDGAIYMRIEAAKEIRRLREYSSKQALDIVTLGQEVGRLREALEDHVRAAECIRHWHDTLGAEGMVVSAKHVRLLWKATRRARAALAEQGEK